MKALVLIGGFGTRLRPITYVVPKQLIPIAGKPMLYHVLDLVPPEVDEVVLATGYKSDAIARAIRDRPPKIRVTVVAETQPLGTGGGIRNAGDSMSDPFLLMNSDVVAGLDLSAMVAFHRQRKAFGTMFLSEVADTRAYGVAALDADDRIQQFVEKPEPADAPSHWINAGFAVWSRELLDRIPKGQAVSLEREIIPGLLDRGVYGYRDRGFWDDAGTPDRLLHAQRLLFDAGRGGSLEPTGPPGIRGPVALAASARVDGATIGPYVTVSEGALVGPGAHVEDSVIMDGATIGPDAKVVGSLIGPRTVVPAGSVVLAQVLCTAPSEERPSRSS